MIVDRRTHTDDIHMRSGAVLQMFNHGTITAMLFLLVGVIYDRAHHRDIEGFGGLAAIMPTYTGVSALAFFASMGLPGLSGFICGLSGLTLTGFVMNLFAAARDRLRPPPQPPKGGPADDRN